MFWATVCAKNSSRDEIANVNFFTTTSSTTFTQCSPKATEFAEITQNKGHYAVQDHSRSLILVPIASSYTISYLWLILTYLLSCNVFDIIPSIGQKSLYLATRFAFNRPTKGFPISYHRRWHNAKTRYVGLHFCCSSLACLGISSTSFTQCAPKSTEFGEITQNKGN